MKTKGAILWGVGEQWSVEEIEVGDPVFGEVTVELAASGLCHSDEHLVTGDLVDFGRPVDPARTRREPPLAAQRGIDAHRLREQQPLGLAILWHQADAGAGRVARAAHPQRRAAARDAAGVDVIRADETDRLRECGAEDCDGVLLDLSRNRSKRFCSQRCANRTNMTAYRRRQAGDIDDRPDSAAGA